MSKGDYNDWAERYAQYKHGGKYSEQELDEYAKSEAILFAEWINKEGWREYDGSDRWIRIEGRQVLETKNLYDLYRTTKRREMTKEETLVKISLGKSGFERETILDNYAKQEVQPFIEALSGACAMMDRARAILQRDGGNWGMLDTSSYKTLIHNQQ